MTMHKNCRVLCVMLRTCVHESRDTSICSRAEALDWIEKLCFTPAQDVG